MLINIKSKDNSEFKDRYFLEFQYDNIEEQKAVYRVFKNGLIPCYGSKSNIFNKYQNFVVPYYINEIGEYTKLNTGIIGGANMSSLLLSELVRRFLDVDAATVMIGDYQMTEFDQDILNKLISQLDNSKQYVLK